MLGINKEWLRLTLQELYLMVGLGLQGIDKQAIERQNSFLKADEGNALYCILYNVIYCITAV